MRILVLAVALVAIGCASSETLPDEQPGTGGSPRRPDARPADGTGGAMPCDQYCQVADLWQKYLTADAAAVAAAAQYDRTYSAAVVTAQGVVDMKCATYHPPSTCPWYGRAVEMALVATDVRAAQAAWDEANRLRDDAYNAYTVAAIAVGMNPLPKNSH